ncbi:MAG: gamma carbonic anhydrase family protein [Planctomycetota bacterium]
MAIYRLGEDQPELDPSCFVAENASLIGKVILESEASVWFSAVLRGDNEPIRVGEQSNVQDGAVLHTDPGLPLTIGRRVTVGHQAMLHSCTIGDQCLIGMQAMILNDAVIGSGSLVAAGSLVTGGKQFPEGSLILGRPAKVVGEVQPRHQQEIQRACESYLRRLTRYRDTLANLRQSD